MKSQTKCCLICRRCMLCSDICDIWNELSYEPFLPFFLDLKKMHLIFHQDTWSQDIAWERFHGSASSKAGHNITVAGLTHFAAITSVRARTQIRPQECHSIPRLPVRQGNSTALPLLTSEQCSLGFLCSTFLRISRVRKVLLENKPLNKKLRTTKQTNKNPNKREYGG